MTTEDYRIRDILRRHTRAHVVELVRRRESAYYEMARLCESPNERLLLAPLMFIAPKCLAPRYEGPLDLSHEARLIPQHQVGKYRVDFAYIVKPYKAPFQIKIAIECDGHDYHASKEQRGNDAARGNDLVALGYTLMRFTGSQIHQRPEGCAQDVEEAVDRIFAEKIFQMSNANNNGDDGERVA